jgi:hypothetical protein
MPRLGSVSRCPRCGFKLPQDKEFTQKIRDEHPNAFHDLTKAGASIIEMCQKLGRQPSAIKRRMDLLNLKFEPTPAPAPKDTTEVWREKEREELERLATDQTPGNGHPATEAVPSHSNRTRQRKGNGYPQTR